MGNKGKGLYGKFLVTRTDGQSEPGKKHDGCGYWVIDITHDPYADVVLLAYAKACRAASPRLARDLLSMLHVDSITDEVHGLLEEIEAELRTQALHMDSMEGERGWS